MARPFRINGSPTRRARQIHPIRPGTARGVSESKQHSRYLSPETSSAYPSAPAASALRQRPFSDKASSVPKGKPGGEGGRNGFPCWIIGRTGSESGRPPRRNQSSAKETG